MNNINSKELDDVQYIGDGVYAGRHGNNIWVFLSNGIQEEDNSFICIQPQVMKKLEVYNETIVMPKIGH